MSQFQQQLLFSQNSPLMLSQLYSLNLFQQQSQSFTQLYNEEQTASQSELESFSYGRSKQNSESLTTEFVNQRYNQLFFKFEKKNNEKKKSVVIIDIPRENPAIPQMLNYPSKFLNPILNSYRLKGDIFINEDAIKASLGMIDASVLNTSIIPIMSSINIYKAVEQVIISKNNSVCNIFFRDTGMGYTDWRYIVQRFESFNHCQFKIIAGLIKKIGQSENEIMNNKSNTLACDSQCSTINNIESSELKSDTTISPENKTSSSKNLKKKNSKNNLQSMSDLKEIENKISITYKDSLTYTYQIKNNNLNSIHFSKNFLECAGWEISQFSMFCLYNGLPELISHEEYYKSVIQMLSEKINSNTNSSNISVEPNIPQVYLNKQGQKIETQTKLISNSSSQGNNMIYHIANIQGETNKKPNNARSQKARGRKHFSQIEQDTLEYNLECPLNEMDRHQHRVCKFRIVHNKQIIKYPQILNQQKIKHKKN